MMSESSPQGTPLPIVDGATFAATASAGSFVDGRQFDVEVTVVDGAELMLTLRHGSCGAIQSWTPLPLQLQLDALTGPAASHLFEAHVITGAHRLAAQAATETATFVDEQ
jgi:hypothetical protein